MKSVGRVPEKELNGKNKSRDHEIILPRLIESDEENKTEDEEENLNEKLKYDKDSKSAPQNTSVNLGNGRPAGKERDERDTVNEYNIKFSTFQTPKNRR